MATIAYLLAAVTALAGGDRFLFEDETDTRLIADPSVGAADVQEKDYAWGDVDQDGDTDLVVVRKIPWTTAGPRRNVLLLNEDGVLVDRTAEFASDADVVGDQGFLTPTDDRDVLLVDVNADGWPDIVTAPAYGQGLPQHLSHPRIYINLGEDQGAWQGFRYEAARIPALPLVPNFAAVAAGDVTGDGAPDLYFTDHVNSLEDRLLVNDGTGFFADETEQRVPPWLTDGLFGAHAVIADLNHDGAQDILKVDAVTPHDLRVAYNDPDNIGFFSEENGEILYNGSALFVAAGDLNNDELLDLVAVDDGTDRYFLNQGNGADGHANFLVVTLPATTGFGGNTIIADLDADGFNDAVVTDVEVDLPGCDRTTRLFGNQGNLPDVTLLEDSANIASAMRTGVHDVAALDIDGDAMLDLVLGRCTGTQVWMNRLNVLTFAFPAGLPELVPSSGTSFEVQIETAGNATLDPDSTMIHVAVQGGPFVSSPLEALGGDLFRASLAGAGCLDRLDFYVSAETTAGQVFTEPQSAPAESFGAVVADGTQVILSDSLEGDVSGWEVSSDPSLVSGAWERADPNATFVAGEMAAPEDDATPGPGNVRAFVTENCEGMECDAAGATDVDGGPTFLISPILDLAGVEARISFARWFFNNDTGSDDEDLLRVSVTNGGAWVDIPALETNGTGGVWESVSFIVSDHVTPNANVRVRFATEDTPNNSITEAGIDDLLVEELVCGPACPWDLDGGGAVGTADLLSLLAAWGTDPGGPPDFDGNGVVNTGDLLDLLAHWGPCPR